MSFLQSPLSQDPAVMVRVAYAENIALLAETALRWDPHSSPDHQLHPLFSEFADWSQ